MPITSTMPNRMATTIAAINPGSRDSSPPRSSTPSWTSMPCRSIGSRSSSSYEHYSLEAAIQIPSNTMKSMSNTSSSSSSCRNYPNIKGALSGFSGMPSCTVLLVYSTRSSSRGCTARMNAQGTKKVASHALMWQLDFLQRGHNMHHLSYCFPHFILFIQSNVQANCNCKAAHSQSILAVRKNVVTCVYKLNFLV